MLDVGGLEFLAQLRPNVEKDLQSIVDGILDCLFHLPTADDEIHAPECVYRHKITTGRKMALKAENLSLCLVFHVIYNALPFSSIDFCFRFKNQHHSSK